MYFDGSGNLVVRVRDSNTSSAARLKAAQIVARRGIRAGTGHRTHAVVVESASSSFYQLAAWRDIASDHLLGRFDIITVDLDEVRNAVTLGVVTNQVDIRRSAILSTAAALGIDPKAILIEPQSPIEGAVGHSGPNSATDAMMSLRAQTSAPCYALVTDLCRPAVAGLGIQRSSGHICTIGLVAQQGGVLKWISASHCTQRKFTTNHDAMYQANYSPSTYFGFEEYDPNGYTCGLNLGPCRGSDAALFAFAPGVTAMLGVIARPVERRGPGEGAGSATVNIAEPYLRIENGNDVTYAGMEYDKIGRTSGWTYGFITATCIDYVSTQGSEPGYYVKIRCTDKGTALALGGDSGGPVFTEGEGLGVRILGITTANPDGGTLFSRYSRLAADLRGNSIHSFVISRPASLQAPVLTASLGVSEHLLSWSSVPGAIQYTLYAQDYCLEYDYDGYPYPFSERTRTVITSTSLAVDSRPMCGPIFYDRQYWVVAESTMEISPESNSVIFEP